MPFLGVPSIRTDYYLGVYIGGPSICGKYLVAGTLAMESADGVQARAEPRFSDSGH